MDFIEIIAGIIAILLLLIFMLFLYCAVVINRHYEEGKEYETRKLRKSKTNNNDRANRKRPTTGRQTRAYDKLK